ncbi:MAG TPA: TetR family transcriptional regulator [Myxococcota bacterium]|nr:TetR family transcriptional regulator [Myxococcota bacterium]
MTNGSAKASGGQSSGDPASGSGAEKPDRAETPTGISSDGALVDQAGRPLGPRAIQTRQRILEATVELLDEKPMRDLRVIDIARRIGTSPATFYQYFKDVEDVVLFLAREASEQTPEIVDVIHGDWTGRAGHERARQLVELVIRHWERYSPILRVRNNASDEGDERFRKVRLRAMMPIVHVFVDEIQRAHERAGEPGKAEDDDSWQGGRVDPIAGATALTSVLERLAMYHTAIGQLGGTREGLVETAATLIQTILTSRR